jgi:hypothetical protein
MGQPRFAPSFAPVTRRPSAGSMGAAARDHRHPPAKVPDKKIVPLRKRRR